MIYLFHGPGKLGMLNRITSVRESFDPADIRELSSKELSWNQAKLELSTDDLFSNKRLFILEDFSDADLSEIVIDPQLSIILKFNKTLPSNSIILKKLPKEVSVVSFDEAKETSIFPLLDFLSEKNPQALLELDKHLDEWGTQYVLTMIFYNLRKFILPGKNTPAFVARKLESQKKNFSLDRINNLYKETLMTDFKLKNGLIEEKIGLQMLAQKFLN